MGIKIKALFLALFCLILTQPSFASPCRQPVNNPPSGFYLGAFGGANWVHFKDLYHKTQVDCKDRYYGGLALGYSNCGSPLRLEGEVAYRTNSIDHFKQCGIRQDCHLHTHNLSYMGNLLCDLDCFPFTPYAGVGIGYVQTHGMPKISDVIATESSSSDIAIVPELDQYNSDGFAWQIIAGVSYPLLTCVDIGIEYRYFQAKDEMDNHSLGLALRTAF